jgi:hypothetical protein
MMSSEYDIFYRSNSIQILLTSVSAEDSLDFTAHKIICQLSQETRVQTGFGQILTGKGKFRS